MKNKINAIFPSFLAILLSTATLTFAQTGGQTQTTGPNSGPLPVADCSDDVDNDRADSSCAATFPVSGGNISNTTGFESKIEMITTACPAPNQAFSSITRRTSTRNLSTGATDIISNVVVQTCPGTNALNVAIQDAVGGNQNVRVISDTPAGAINCGVDCQEMYSGSGAPTNVSLSFAPGEVLPSVGFGYTYTITGLPNVGAACTARYENTVYGPGWKDGIQMNCSGDNVTCLGHTCSVLMNKARTVNVTFSANTPPTPYDLNVTVVSSGFVTNGSGISCGATCTQSYTSPQNTTLYAIPNSGFVFSDWSGGCSGMGDCTVAVGSSTVNVTATFTAVPPPATFNLYGITMGAGTGTITSAPAGINCGADCHEIIANGNAVTVTATPTGGSTFTGWSGDCSGMAANCNLTINADKYAVASFSPPGPTPPTCNAGTLVTSWTNSDNTLNVTISGVNNANSVNIYMAHTTGTPSAYPAVHNGTGSWTSSMNGATLAGDYTISVRMSNGSFTDVVCTTSTATRPVSAGATYNLTVNKTGTGANTNTGTVNGNRTSAPAGVVITCGGDCSEAGLATGATVTLSAVASGPNQTFTGWSGDCTGAGACNLTMNSNKTVNATFNNTAAGGEYTLAVSKPGNGVCTVTSSSPATPAINCGATCSQNYPATTVVSMTAAPAVGTIWGGWAGGCTGSGTCNVTMSANQNVTANCTLSQHLLSVTKSGTGAGTVTATGITCGADCSENVNYGSSVNLTATADVGSTFAAWTGCDSVAGNVCTVSVTAARSVNAQFTINQYTLTAAKAGAGACTITSAPAGINCGGDCTENYNYNTSVTLTASAAVGNSFASWAGCDTVAGNTCTLAVTSARTATATCNINNYTLTVLKAGGGTGTVTGYGINCGVACGPTAVPYGATLSMAAAATGGSTFTGWSSAPPATMPASNLTLTANFTPPCTPWSQTGTGSCPAGYDNGYTNTQIDYYCPSGNSGWYTTSTANCGCNAGRSWNGSTCANNCVATFETRTSSCVGLGYDTGTYPERRDYTCSTAWAGSWGGWYETAGRTCACNAGRTWNGSTCVPVAAPCVVAGNTFASGTTYWVIEGTASCGGAGTFSSNSIITTRGTNNQSRYLCNNGVGTAPVEWTCSGVSCSDAALCSSNAGDWSAL